MASAPYILARSLKEAHEFARGELGLAHGRYRIVNTPSTLKSVRGVDLYLAPGWRNRFDRFAMIGAIRWTRMNVIDWAEQAEAPVELDGLEPAGTQPTLDADEATAFFDVPEAQLDEPEPEQTDTDAEAEEPKRRRRRCKDCGVLVDPDELEQHASEHLPEA